MALNLNEWNIQSRATQCAVTGRAFTEGESVYSSLYWKDGAYQRVDLCEEAWKQRNENIAPLSSWKFHYEPPTPPPPEALHKDDAESLLRHLMQENDPAQRNTRYILTLMLERKKILRMIDRQKNNDETILIYEHLPSGETWLIQDPHLKLAELEPVQQEVSILLGGGTPSSAPAEAPVENSSPELPESAPSEPAADSESTSESGSQP